MLVIANDRVVFIPQRCCQCAVCLPVCPTNALTMTQGRDGLFDMAVNESSCALCGLCVKVCPAPELPKGQFSEETVRHAAGIYLGYAKDETVRRMSSSGGAGRVLLSHLLASGAVDAVYSLIYPESQAAGTAAPTLVEPTGREAEGQWLLKPPPQHRVPCSLYRPLPWGLNLNKVNRQWKRVMLIGLPCEILGAKLLLGKIARRVEIVSVALLCRSQKSLHYTRALQRVAGCRDAATPMVTYRGQGWAGRCGDPTRMCSWFKHGGFAFDYLMQLWRVPGCRACSICLADKAADVTLADPWGLLQEATDDLGCNLVFAWTQKGVELLAQAEPVLTLFPASPEEALTSIDPRSIRYKNLYEIPCFLGQEPRFSRRFEYAVNGVKRAWLEFCIPFLPARLIRFPFGILRLLRLLSLPFSRLFSFSYRALRFIKRRLKRILLRSPA